ncbi:MAG TPA: MBL fold metallo-hydrolase [Candidatus Omnitrophota bacterium]|nr:MBL fold metallo-hydrolase [Candidatus Omnitrophota bacterium]
MILETVLVGSMQVNCYILAEGENSLSIIIDPGDEEGKIKKVLTKYKLTPGMLINTHGHIDHIGADDKFNVPVYAHSQDSSLLKDPRLNLSDFLVSGFSVKSKIHNLKDKQIIALGGIELEVIHIPGHTPGGISLLLKRPKNKILFTGDSLFCQGIGRTDFPGADGKLLIKSIKEKLFALSDDTIIYPGHGASSTIGEEKRNNPFLN